jgi:hypothetical protein
MDRWYKPLIPKELETARVSIRSKNSNLCILCRGGRNLCGKATCPIELKAKAYIKNLNIINSTEFIGSSPPSVFVGRYGYPFVSVGPMVPPFSGNTEVMDIPEDWIGKDVETLVNYRFSLIRGSTRLPIDSVRKGGRIVDALQELSMGTSAAETEIEFFRRPADRVTFDDNSQPFGPSAPLKKFDIASVKVDKKIEKAYYDRDLLANEAVFGLYDDGLQVSRLQRAFSMGVFGVQKNRKMVPTRWSITAVDSMLSERILDEVKGFDAIEKYQVYSYKYEHNTFAAILMPKKWSYEWMEAWFPGTFWNLGGSKTSVEGDAEGWYGRKTYPGIGGCYYSTRLGVAEHLRGMRRQATALIVREIMPEFPLPLGVWFVRENIRSMFKTKPEEFEDLKSCLLYLKKILVVPTAIWLEKSMLLRDAMMQKSID